ncbi:MAG: hypothetical protein GY801_03600, partial [bacterium]|nr:hypothetical protein [bacterium]
MLINFQEKFDYSTMLHSGVYYQGVTVSRTMKTIYGEVRYMNPRVTMMQYKKLIEEDLVIASGIVEGAARYVVGERMDCRGMRWIPERAEA